MTLGLDVLMPTAHESCTPDANLHLNRSCLRGRSNPVWDLGLHIRHHSQQVFDHFVPRLTSSLLDAL